MPTTTTETNHHKTIPTLTRTVHTASASTLPSINNNTHEPIHQLISQPSSMSSTVHTTVMEYMYRLGIKTSWRTSTDEDKDI